VAALKVPPEMDDPLAIRKFYNSVLEQGGLGGLVRVGN
jgi:hypothetical protein